MHSVNLPPQPLKSKISHCLAELTILDDPPSDIESGVSLIKLPEYGSKNCKVAVKLKWFKKKTRKISLHRLKKRGKSISQTGRRSRGGSKTIGSYREISRKILSFNNGD